MQAFEQYDMEALTSLIHEDATQSMPPFDMWLSGRDDILTWWVGPGGGCRGSRVIPTRAANGAPAFGQYKPNDAGDGYEPWALQVLEIEDGRIVEFTFFLDTERVFPLFGLPLEFLASPQPVLAGQDVGQAHEAHQLQQLLGGPAQPYLASVPPRGELQARERVDRHRVDLDTAHVADRDVGPGLREQGADAVAQPG